MKLNLRSIGGRTRRTKGATLIAPSEERSSRNAIALLREAMASKNTLACCGLDPDLAKMPLAITDPHASNEVKVLRFLREVVDITGPHVCAFKIQKAFFDIFPGGHDLLQRTIAYAHEHHPEVPVFLDAKIGDIGNTMEVYLHNVFGELRADGVVLNPYMGDDVLMPFAQLPDKAGLALVKTSNQGANIVQDTILAGGRPLWQHILALTVDRWNGASNMIPVLASTADVDFSGVRKIIPDDMPVLFVGFGVQGGGLGHLRELLDSSGRGVFVNSSRGLLYPYEPDDTDWRTKIENAVLALKVGLNQERGPR